MPADQKPTGASPAADFAERETKLIALPRLGANGKQLSMLIGAVPTIELVKAMEGVPELNKGTGEAVQQSFERVRELLLEQERPQQAIAALGVVDPPLSFGDTPEAGKAPWRNIHGENQAFIIAEIMSLSGFGPAKTEAAATAESFRPVAGQ